MKESNGSLGYIIGALIAAAVFYAVMAQAVSLSITFVLGYEIGFLRTAVGIFLVVVASKLVFIGIPSKEAE